MDQVDLPSRDEAGKIVALNLVPPCLGKLLRNPDLSLLKSLKKSHLLKFSPNILNGPN